MIAIDSSSLILLAKIGALDKAIQALKKRLTITNQIFIETTIKDDTFDAKIIKKRVEEKAIFKRVIKNFSLYDKLQQDFNIGKGEAEAIVFCLENKIGLITDDRKAMNACRLLKIRFTTVPNIIISLYKEGILTKDESEIYIKKMKKFGRYSALILQKMKEELKNEENE